MTMYELSDPRAVDILEADALRGVLVRVLLDSDYERSYNQPAFTSLSSNGVQVRWAPDGTIFHQKTFSVDGRTSAIMTLNLTPEDYSTTRDFAVITNDAADVAAIEATFEADFTNTTITAPAGDNLVWSPTNSRSALLALINGAAKTLLISQEEFDDTGIQSAVEAALKRGVNGAYSSVLNTLKAAGARIAIFSSKTGYYIHAKTVLADYGTAEAKLFVGSENFSADSLSDNRELGLIFSDAACMEGVEAAITADFNKGTRF